MKERQRWQPEEDAILKAYVKQYGPKEWNLISQRMPNHPLLHRDPKSCLERWKNYLKPGIKKGSLSPEEQSLVISLQAKYGNKWKKIATEVPGRTAKRLGKWWEVFKEKQLKQLREEGNIIPAPVHSNSSPDKVAQGRYDHILQTFADKYVVHHPIMSNISLPDPEPLLSLGSTSSATVLPLWMNNNHSTSSLSSSTNSSNTTPSPSVSLSLSSSEPALDSVDLTRFMQVGTLVHYCKDLEESRHSWMQHKKEATWRLNRLEQQLESEKARKRREKMEEIEAKIRCLRDEEMSCLGRIENEYKEQLIALQRDAETKEAKLMETWCTKHLKLVQLVEQIGVQSSHGQHI
ncbi:hypothetical protein ACOSP7_028313 [Xanthoceras sorbifolium]|uniref:Uncharacterized protein n=1 Tax=Xanthoceras sorbifolium TaxID=99658 RepID=A0ABQ8HD29_9ROSI|nr:hypothetical protein JRO89_XS12G0194400 [Xanthoceras sorbifolium]